jgi:hypothetical protein
MAIGFRCHPEFRHSKQSAQKSDRSRHASRLHRRSTTNRRDRQPPDGGALGVETLPRPADDTRQRRRGEAPACGLVQSMWSPERTWPGRAGTLVWARDASARMAPAPGLLTMRKPKRRLDGDRLKAVRVMPATALGAAEQGRYGRKRKGIRRYPSAQNRRDSKQVNGGNF